MLKYLRIAVTAFSLTACVLLVALWVRSYWRWEHVALGATPGQGFLVASANGAPLFQYDDAYGTAWRRIKWHVHSAPTPEQPFGERRRILKGFDWHTFGSGFALSVPYWFLVVLAIALAAVPWFPWSRRFSLRTLLIATTLIAMGLGIIVMSR
jgi:hypothetical protein